MYGQKPSIYEVENRPYYKGEQTKHEKTLQDMEYPPM
jgi:hypothetical protein